MEGPKGTWELSVKVNIKRMILEVAEWINVARYISSVVASCKRGNGSLSLTKRGEVF